MDLKRQEDQRKSIELVGKHAKRGALKKIVFNARETREISRLFQMDRKFTELFFILLNFQRKSLCPDLKRLL